MNLADIPDIFATPDKRFVALIKRGNTNLEYVGHADITLMLIAADPDWSLSWLTKDDGTMNIVHRAPRLVLEGSLTVLGKTLPCLGTCADDKWEPEKELIGDLIRNGAMRFGFATKLWSRTEGQM